MSATDIIKAVLPWIGTALGGPLGGVAADIVGKTLGLENKTVDSVKAVLAGMPPEELAKLKIAEMDMQLKSAQLGYDNIQKLAEIEYKTAELETRNVENINKTMQAEAAAEHWPSYSWRPYNGFLFGTTIFCCYVLLPLFKIPPPVIPNEVWLAWGGILGIASFFRGKAQADPNIPAAIQIPARHTIVEKVIGKTE